jgi:hypothetical protein
MKSSKFTKKEEESEPESICLLKKAKLGLCKKLFFCIIILSIQMLFPRTPIEEDSEEENFNTFNQGKANLILDDDEIAGNDQTFHNPKVVNNS